MASKQNFCIKVALCLKKLCKIPNLKALLRKEVYEPVPVDSDRLSGVTYTATRKLDCGTSRHNDQTISGGETTLLGKKVYEPVPVNSDRLGGVTYTATRNIDCERNRHEDQTDQTIPGGETTLLGIEVYEPAPVNSDRLSGVTYTATRMIECGTSRHEDQTDQTGGETTLLSKEVYEPVPVNSDRLSGVTYTARRKIGCGTSRHNDQTIPGGETTLLGKEVYEPVPVNSDRGTSRHDDQTIPGGETGVDQTTRTVYKGIWFEHNKSYVMKELRVEIEPLPVYNNNNDDLLTIDHDDLDLDEFTRDRPITYLQTGQPSNDVEQPPPKDVSTGRAAVETLADTHQRRGSSHNRSPCKRRRSRSTSSSSNSSSTSSSSNSSSTSSSSNSSSSSSNSSSTGSSSSSNSSSTGSSSSSPQPSPVKQTMLKVEEEHPQPAKRQRTTMLPEERLRSPLKRHIVVEAPKLQPKRRAPSPTKRAVMFLARGARGHERHVPRVTTNAPVQRNARDILQHSFRDKSNTYTRPFEATGITIAPSRTIQPHNTSHKIMLMSPPLRDPGRRRRIKLTVTPITTAIDRPKTGTKRSPVTTDGTATGTKQKPMATPKKRRVEVPPTMTVTTYHHENGKRVLQAIVNPLSNELLFVDALLEDNVCFGFAAATGNIFCKGYGVPYDLKAQVSMTEPNRRFSPSMEKLFNQRGHFRNFVDPKDVVRFAIQNTSQLSIVIGCNLESLLKRRDTTFLTTYCCMKPEAPTYKDRHICHYCYYDNPPSSIHATYVSKSHMLFCDEHARRFRHTEDLLLYLPVLVSIRAEEDRIVLSMSNRPTVIADQSSPHYGKLNGKSNRLRKEEYQAWSPLVAITPQRAENLKTSDVANLLAHITSMNHQPDYEVTPMTTSDPFHKIKLMQELCEMLKSNVLK